MKFINNTKNEIIENVLNGYKRRVDNEFYIYQSNYVLGTYYNINDNRSTTLNNTSLIESSDGIKSPILFDKFMNMPIGGLSDIDVDIEYNEFGEEGSDITGDIFLFPNIIIPTSEDRFRFNHIPDLLFKVTSSTTIKLDNGKNMWKLSYKLDKTDIKNSNIENLISDIYHVIIDNIGSNMKIAIKNDDYVKVKNLDKILSNLKNKYMSSFYSSHVDTLILKHNNIFIYDPYLIEFIIRTNLMEDNNIRTIFYHHIDNNVMEFNQDFEDTIFNAIINNDITKFKTNNFNLNLINDIMSIFLTRNDQYFKVIKNHKNDFFFSKFSYFNSDTEIEIKNINTKDKLIKIITYCINGRKINDNDIYLLDNLIISHNKYYFYIIPLLVFSIQEYVKKILSKSNK